MVSVGKFSCLNKARYKEVVVVNQAAQTGPSKQTGENGINVKMFGGKKRTICF